jgi:hypothetical protein
MEKHVLQDLLKSFLQEWAEATASAIGLQEDLAPTNDPNDSYVLSYRAVIEPTALDRCRVEIWLTDTGHVAVGLEKWQRLASRLGLTTSKGVRFAAGHEPGIVSDAALLALLEVVANGEISILYRTVWHRLLGTWAGITPNGLSALQKGGYRRLCWTSKIVGHDDINGFPQHLFGGVARYQRW